MNNNSRSPVAEMLSGKYKIWLVVGLAIMLVIDCIACGVLIARDSSGYLFLPIVMTIIDALYLAAVVFSNQRFKYAKTLFIVYISLTVVCCVLWSIADMTSSIFTTAAIAMWIILHLTSIFAAIITYIYAAKRIKGGRTIQLILAIAFSCVAVLGCGVYYGIQLFTDGYFGQGSGVRPLRYEYYADNTCAVVGVVRGNEKNVVVPYEFNGSKVVGVSALVLDDGVKNITFECDPNVELFKDYNTVGASNLDVNIYVEKDKVDVFKKKFYDIGKVGGGFYNIFDLGNRVRPAGLSKDDVYITFDHDSNAYTYSRNQMIPTWYGKKGDVFDLKDFAAEGVDFALHSDIRSDEDLDWSYNNYSQNIMSALEYKGTKIDGIAIGESCHNVPVRFQRIYRIYAGSGNDDKFNTSDHFNFSVVNGQKRDYKYTVAEIADELLEPFERGDGFVRQLRFKRGGETWTRFNSLTEMCQSIEQGTNVDITIEPVWALVQPEVKISTLDDKTEVVYGDAFSLTANVTHPLGDDIQIDYEWSFGGQKRGNEQTYNVNKISYVGEAEYTIIATVSAPDVTSLTTANAANIYINSSKRPLTAVWTDPISNVYDDTDKIITVAFTNIAEGDSISPWNASYTQHNAVTYNYTTSIRGPERDYYYIESGETHSYTILPYPVTLDWGGDEFTYVFNGTAQYPTPTAVDLHGNKLTFGYSLVGDGAFEEAFSDVGDYVMTAEISGNNNYVADTENGNDRRTVHITPKPIDVAWGSADLTFNGNPQAPTASATGVNGAEVKVTVTGRQTKANLIGGEVTTPYTATAAITDKNYKLNPDAVTKAFTIKPFEVTVNWYDTTLTYNGQPQAPRPLAMGINAHLDVTVTGQQTDVGDNYIATAAIDSTDFVITSGESQVFSIVPYTLRVTWSNDIFTFDGLPHNPTVSATGVDGANVPISVTSAPQTNADTYTATAGISDYNYTIATINRTHIFKINKRNITVSWSNTVLTYNGKEQAPTPKLLYAVGEPEFTVKGKAKDASKNYSYTARIELNDGNHQVSQGATCLYSINPKKVEVDWGNLALAYNGQNQVPTASITGVDGEVIELNVWTPWQDVSVVGSYVAYAEFKSPNANYELTGASQKSYNIVKRKINVTVRDVTTWKGVQPQYDFDVDGIVGNEDVAVFCGVSGSSTSLNTVGEYDIMVTMIGSDCGNYELNIVRHGKLTVKAQED